jgi:hypothetical protein
MLLMGYCYAIDGVLLCHFSKHRLILCFEAVFRLHAQEVPMSFSMRPNQSDRRAQRQGVEETEMENEITPYPLSREWLESFKFADQHLRFALLAHDAAQRAEIERLIRARRTTFGCPT